MSQETITVTMTRTEYENMRLLSNSAKFEASGGIYAFFCGDKLMLLRKLLDRAEGV